jgi:cytochrome c556
MRRSALVVLALFGVAGSAGVAIAEPTPIQAYRQNVMKAFGAHAAAIKTALVDETALAGDVVAHARAIEALSASIPKMFPEGSGDGDTYALPTVWSDSAGFSAASTKNAELAAALVKAAESGDNAAALAAFGALGKDGCGGCHGVFRKKS